MPCVRHGATARACHQKVFALAKGYHGRCKNIYCVAKQAVIRAGQYAYRDRCQRRRWFHQLWIVCTNTGARKNGLSYSRFMNDLKRATIEIDHKVSADLAVFGRAVFAKLVEKARAVLAA